MRLGPEGRSLRGHYRRCFWVGVELLSRGMTAASRTCGWVSRVDSISPGGRSGRDTRCPAPAGSVRGRRCGRVGRPRPPRVGRALAGRAPTRARGPCAHCRAAAAHPGRAVRGARPRGARAVSALPPAASHRRPSHPAASTGRPAASPRPLRQSKTKVSKFPSPTGRNGKRDTFFREIPYGKKTSPIPDQRSRLWGNTLPNKNPPK